MINKGEIILIENMNEQLEHLKQLVEQRDRLTGDLEKLNSQSTRTRELTLKTQGAIEYLEAIGVRLPDPEVTEESETPTEDG